MIGYMTLGTNDLPRAIEFWNAIFIDQGVKAVQPNDRLMMWMKEGKATFGVIEPFDGQPATVGNGDMAAFMLESHDEVKKIYDRAISLGAKDEGEPGPRGTGKFFGGYFRDPDGHKICVYSYGG